MDKSHSEAEALKFLERDFNQCFEQMRHYENQLFEIVKFLFMAYSALIGVSIGFYQFGLSQGRDLHLPAVAALGIALVLGIFMFAIAVRNRVYFVQVVRYINEQRGFFFKCEPLGFKNKSGMYTNPALPLYFNWRSSQAWMTYLVAGLNAVLFGVLLFVSAPAENRRHLVLGGSALLFFTQLFVGIRYLVSREGKSASKAVFGRE